MTYDDLRKQIAEKFLARGIDRTSSWILTGMIEEPFLRLGQHGEFQLLSVDKMRLTARRPVVTFSAEVFVRQVAGDERTQFLKYRSRFNYDSGRFKAKFSPMK